VRIDEVPDPSIQEPTDAIVRITSTAVYGLDPIGQMCSRIARHKGAETVIAVDNVPERLAMAQRHGIETINSEDHDDVPATIREMTDGRGPDAVIDAVGMEAHGAPGADLIQKSQACCRTLWRRRQLKRQRWTGFRPCSNQSTPCGAEGLSRSRGSTVASSTPCR
jgi:threonine dehydrogenase-like Zn-dependent dehydrogenase